MTFTYEGYEHLISSLIENGYTITSYDDCDQYDKCAIMRHDIDYDLSKTLRIAEIEKKMGARSTFFLLLSSDFYNVFSAEGKSVITYLQTLGHEVALHFDEQRYREDFGNPEVIRSDIMREAQILSEVTGQRVTKVSMHRPSKEIIDCDLCIPDMINTYAKRYMTDYKYVSDSRRRWREPLDDYILGNRFNKLQILVHPFWYNETELSIGESLMRFVKESKYRCYDGLSVNFTNLEEIIKREDV